MLRPISILLACAGLCMAIYVVATAKEVLPSPQPAQPPSINPYVHGIAALGLVEPGSRPIEVAAPEAARVVAVEAAVNQRVKAGDVLFTLDTVPFDAEMIRAKAALESAEAEVHRLEQWPRAEDFPPVEAEIAEARSRLDDASKRLESLTAAAARNAASDDEVTRQRYLVSTLRANMANAEARLARMKAGSWTQDLEVARSVARARQADIAAIQKRLDRMTVRSPRDATVLQRNIEPGEWASVSAGMGGQGSGPAPMILGDLSEMHVRAQVDEEDTPLLRPGAKAVARIRGPVDAQIMLTMLRIEPYARPKSQITGASTELVDTRVIEVVFRAEPAEGAPTLYTGQVVDVYIESSEESERITTAAAPKS
jgi:HlyD family secretion protein